MADYETILETERLIFRQHIVTDIDDYCAIEMDANFRRFVGGRPRTREEAEQKFKGALKPVTDRLSIWAAILKKNGSYIGRCGIYPHFSHDGGTIEGEASLGLYIGTAYWGRGFATEAGQAFIQLGFEQLKLNRIVTMVQVGNDASVRVLQKLGFVLKEAEIGKRSFYHFELLPNN